MHSLKEYLLNVYYVWHPVSGTEDEKNKDVMLLSPSSSVLGEARGAVDSQAHLGTSCGTHHDGAR